VIDVESEIFSTVSEKVREKYPGIYLTDQLAKAPPSFPCASLIEMDNATFRHSQTTEGQENHAAVMYELNVYSNKTKGKKTECKGIIACIDEILMGLNFTRIMLEPVPNQDDATIYRMLGRYRAVVSRDKTIFRR
jgi:hypothetical protein